MMIRKNLLPWIFIGMFCVLLAPNLIYGLRDSHDIHFHMMLFLSYRDGVELGALYPRWLPDQLHGLGTPALLVYPPLTAAFFVLVDFLTLHLLGPGRVMGVGAILLSIASAAAFYAWARQYVSTRLALIVALFYATAPYHLTIDLYRRGALAEYTTFVWIPLIFLAIRKTILVGNARNAALLAISICALFLTHLLTSMLVAPLALVYALICLRMESPAGTWVTRFMLLTLTAIVGVALAAFYYVPAVTLLNEANSGALSTDVKAGSFYKVIVELYRNIVTSNLSSVLRGLSPKEKFWMGLILLACIYFAIYLYSFVEAWNSWRKRGSFGVSTALASMWILSGVACFALMFGMFPFIFYPPSPYAQIQFSWRLLVVMEFSLLALFVCNVAGAQDAVTRTRLLKAGLIVSVLLTISQLGQIAFNFIRLPISVNAVEEDAKVKLRLAPLEYFPIGTKRDRLVTEAIKPFERYALASEPAFVNGDTVKLVAAMREGGRFTVHSIASVPTPIMIQQFYFPGWKAFDENRNEIEVFSDQDSRMASYLAPAGDHVVVIQRAPTRSEHIGNIISMGALAAFILELGFLALRRRNSQRLQSPTSGS